MWTEKSHLNDVAQAVCVACTTCSKAEKSKVRPDQTSECVRKLDGFKA